VAATIGNVTISGSSLANAKSERLLELSGRLYQLEDFSRAAAALSQGQDATLDGVWGSSCALVAAELLAVTTGVLVVVCPDQDDIDGFCDDFTLFSTVSPARFPAWESEPGERLLHDEIYADRLRTLKRLAGTGAPSVGTPHSARLEVPAKGPADGPALVVTSIQSLLQTTPDRERLARSCRRIRVGQRVDVDELLAWLAERRFHHTTAVELPGEFSSRGGIVDVFALDWYEPVRIEFFDDEVESIRRFDIGTQRSLESLDEVEITIVQPGSQDRGHFSEFLPAGSVVMLLEPERAAESALTYLKRLERPQDFHSYREVMQDIGRFPVATVSSLAGGALGATCHLPIVSVERFSGE
jgi:transcription-repair coupling factor (superfamily II helicase)